MVDVFPSGVVSTVWQHVHVSMVIVGAVAVVSQASLLCGCPGGVVVR